MKLRRLVEQGRGCSTVRGGCGLKVHARVRLGTRGGNGVISAETKELVDVAFECGPAPDGDCVVNIAGFGLPDVAERPVQRESAV